MLEILMLVLSRKLGQSVIGRKDHLTWTVTVIGLNVEDRTASLLIHHASPDIIGGLALERVELTAHEKYSLGTLAEITLVDVQPDRIRLGIESDDADFVSRLEFFESLQQGEDDNRDDDDPPPNSNGPGDAPVPRPSSPAPPSLSSSKQEPGRKKDKRKVKDKRAKRKKARSKRKG